MPSPIDSPLSAEMPVNRSALQSSAARLNRALAPFLLSVGFLLAAHVTPVPLATPPNAWASILGAIGLPATSVLVAHPGEARTAMFLEAADAGRFVVLEGDSPAARALGFQPSVKKVTLRSILDLRNPKLSIIWQQPAEILVTTLPEGATIYAKERWQGVPVMAGVQRKGGAILWLATPPGAAGFERYPYIPQALAELGLKPVVRSNQLWAFFDSSYRLRADVDYLAQGWRKAGISALHVAAWHYTEPDTSRDQYLNRLIEACHRNSILVYAWIELPHVSEKFWNDHPEWREKTGLLQDAQLDWRKLMNLTNRDCFTAASQQIRALLGRFRWDGVNLAELYFESLEGIANPARFTPMNDDVRKRFIAETGTDPLTLLNSKNASAMPAFLNFRATLARQMQTEWIAEIASLRNFSKPDLDLVLTHVDDRFDRHMRELIGADAERLLPLMDTTDFTFLIEDPATIWNLGPSRYQQIASRYAPLTKHLDRLAIDINIVERYQDVYPTKLQTGTELFELVHTAAGNFHRVALYFENSIQPSDLALIPFAASSGTSEPKGKKLQVNSSSGMGLSFAGPAQVDGNTWPVSDGQTVWLPAGTHTLEASPSPAPLLLADFNGTLQSASVTPNGLEFSYDNPASSIARFEKMPGRIAVDDKPIAAEQVVLLPKGKHRVSAGLKP